jgi:hypothetical protein
MAANYNAIADGDAATPDLFNGRFEAYLKGDFHNAKAYGATGLGVADDTAAIQSTIAAAVAAGGTAFVPPGRYRIATKITVPSECTLWMHPEAVIIRDNDTRNHSQATIINADITNGNTNITIIGGHIISNDNVGGVHFRLKKCTKVRLIDLHLGTSEGTWQMILDDCEDLDCTNLRLLNTISAAGDGTDEGNNDGLHIRGGKRLRFLGGMISSGDDTIALGTSPGQVGVTDMEDIVIDGFHLDSRSNNMIRIEKKADHNIRRIRISNITGQCAGTPLKMVNYPTAAQKTAYDPTWTGGTYEGVCEDVVVNGLAAVCVAADELPAEAMEALQVKYVDNLRISGYSVTGATAKGAVNVCNHVTIRDSYIDGSSFQSANNGLQIIDSNDVTLDSVVCDDPTQHGFYVLDSKRVTLNDCKAIGVVRGCMVDGCEDVNIARLDARDATFGVTMSDVNRGSIIRCQLTSADTTAIDLGGTTQSIEIGHNNVRDSSVGIDLQGTVADLDIHDNDMTGCTTKFSPITTYADLVTSRISMRRNKAYTTDAQGTATVANGATTVDVTHGLSVTPNAQDLRVLPTNNLGTASHFWVSNIGATTFRINVDSDPGATTATFSWRAQAY